MYGRKIGWTCSFIIGLVFLLDLQSAGKGNRTAGQGKDGGAVKPSELLLQEDASIKKLDCSYVSAYDADDSEHIAVKTMTTYASGDKDDFLPTVYPNREKAYGACGAWQDEMLRRINHAVEYLKTARR